LVIFVVSLKKI